MSGSAISVEPAALQVIAGKLRDGGSAVERFDDTEHAGAAAGSSLVAQALTGFAESWRDARTATADGLRQLGTLVSGAAMLYEDADLRVRGALVAPEV